MPEPHAFSSRHEALLFHDRADAGAQLAESLTGFRGRHTLVLGIPRSGVPVAAATTAEAQQRAQRLRAGRRAAPVAGRTVILVDDGFATSATMRVAVRSLRAQQAARSVVAVPVGSFEACAALATEADEVVCLYQPRDFGAVSQFYRDFRPTEDEDVLRILRTTHEMAPASE